jgi:HNH endonuclease
MNNARVRDTHRANWANHLTGPRPLEERFWPKVRVGKPDECWEWDGARFSPTGYGAFQFGVKKTVRAHRIAFQLAGGLLPPGMLVLHHCDNPPCCNPAHLYAGNHSQNNQDCVRRGRRSKPRPPRYLSEAEKRSLAAMVHSISVHAAAVTFGVSWSRAKRIADIFDLGAGKENGEGSDPAPKNTGEAA